jgi:hypothetical protein
MERGRFAEAILSVVEAEPPPSLPPLWEETTAERGETSDDGEAVAVG